MSAPHSVLCTIPGLTWPTKGLADILAPLALPGLSALFAKVTQTDAAPYALDTWLAGQFGLQGELPFAALRLAGELPFAALRLAGERADAGTMDENAAWVCADPVSLRFARQHLLLDAPETLDLQAEETRRLLVDLNETFVDIGRFSNTSPTHIYLALNPEHADKLAVTLAPLADVDSRPVAQFQARGEQAAWWSRLANELQVFCHNHPVNTAREARGAAALNALWLWGVGRLPATPSAPHSDMAARLTRPHAILDGLSHLAHSEIAAFDAQRPAAWSLLDALHVPALQRDATGWAQALAALDADVFVPLSRQLRSGDIAHLRIVTPGDTALTTFDISPTSRWKFWQGAASKAQLVAALGQPAT